MKQFKTKREMGSQVKTAAFFSKCKAVLSCLLAAAMLVTMIPLFSVRASAATVVASGTCGETGYPKTVTWTLTSDGTITFSGNRYIMTYGMYTDTPWDAYKDSITTVVIEPGILSTGAYSFYEYPNLTKVILPEGLTHIGTGTFMYCPLLTEITIPSTVKYIQIYSFVSKSGTGLKTIYYNGTQEEWSSISLESAVHINYANVICALTHYPAVTAACDKPGNVEYYHNSVDNKDYAADRTTVLDDVGTYVPHVIEATSYTWASDFSSCTVTAKCTGCDAVIPTRTTTDIVIIESAPCTCTESGYNVYSAFHDPAAYLTYITPQTIKKTYSPYGHVGSSVEQWADDYSTCTRTKTCLRCGVTVATETINTKQIVKQSTCTAAGYTYYYGTFTDTNLSMNNSLETRTTVPSDILAHSPMEATYELDDAQENMTAKIVCSQCGVTLESETSPVNARSVITPAGCTADGEMNFTANFTNASFASSKTVKVAIPATGHNYVDGVCTNCGEPDPTIPTVDAHNYYQLDSVEDLKWFAAYVNAGNTGANAILLSDIQYMENNSADKVDAPSIINSFSGTFDGNGFTISKTDSQFVATLLSGGEIKNLTISDQRAWTSGAGGGIVGTNAGIVENCIVNNPYLQNSSRTGFGGIAGVNTGTIRNCAVIGGTVMLRYSASNNPGGYSLGGICGVNSGKIENCYLYNTALDNGVTHSAIVYEEKEGGTVSNCYYYSSKVNDTTAGGTALTTAQFASGEAAYLLNSSKTDGTQVWYQTCGTGLPAFSGNTVYCGYENCGSTEKTYANTAETDTIPDHIYGDWTDNGDGTHIRTCTVCGKAEETASHAFGECTDNGNGTHSRTCSVCGYVETLNHTFDNWTDNGNGTHSHTCTVCGYAETESHTFDAWTDNGDGTHSHTCTACGKVEETASHAFGECTDNGNGTHTRYCNVCGYFETDDHAFNSLDCTNNGDGTHTRYCDACGYSETENHKFVDWMDNGDGTHKRFCIVDGCGATEIASHTFSEWIDNGNGTHSHTCTVCGYAETESHNFDAWTDNGDGTHSHTCSVCGVVETVEHTYDENGICTVCGGNEADQHYLKGDINNDGLINGKDSSLFLQLCSGIILGTKLQTEAADINHDGLLNGKDNNRMLSYIIGIISSFD